MYALTFPFYGSPWEFTVTLFKTSGVQVIDPSAEQFNYWLDVLGNRFLLANAAKLWILRYNFEESINREINYLRCASGFGIDRALKLRK
ncbi:hypothetical protein CEXT_123221 [Caerostris extrusa]|uniref:Uncharacterized protein n=1 Tax=Caerostris extrusa TaxID=172846 RepID=A0AAV4XXX4_CAEEX|nr:hypothetical protein CEXT_123221 [Caerostris extrusa]